MVNALQQGLVRDHRGRAAQAAASPAHRVYLALVAGAEATMADNVSAISELGLRPRVADLPNTAT